MWQEDWHNEEKEATLTFTLLGLMTNEATLTM